MVGPTLCSWSRALLDAIREECGLTGTHAGCEHGACGVCTVLLDGEPVRACLMFAAQAQGSAIRTVEGLADGETLHPLQRAFMAHHGLQCGFCTCMGLFLSSSRFGLLPVLCSEREGRSSSRRLRSGSRSARKGSRDRNASK